LNRTLSHLIGKMATSDRNPDQDARGHSKVNGSSGGIHFESSCHSPSSFHTTSAKRTITVEVS
jgi:hypothetical protein